MKFDDLVANSAGHIEVTGSGIAASICSSKAFTKSGFKMTTDRSDCQPCGIKIPEICCPDQDAANASAFGKVQR